MSADHSGAVVSEPLKQPSGRVAVVVNTQKMSSEDASALRRALDSHGITDIDWVEIGQGPEVTGATRGALERGARTVVVCGGDGSIRLAAEALAGTGVALAVVPQGTGNIFVTGLGLPTDVEEVARAVAEGDRETIDTGKCNGMTYNLTAGSGIDVGMMAPSDEEKKRRGMLAYVRAAIHEMLRRRPFEVEVLVDGAPFYAGQSTGVLVGKLGTQLGGVKAFPNVSPTDGLLHVAVITAVGPISWLRLAASVLLRRQRKSRQAEFGQGQRVSVAFNRPRRFELDGDVLGRSPRLECRVDPRSLVICTLGERWRSAGGR